MGTGALSVVAYSQPGQVSAMAGPSLWLSRIWLAMALAFFLFLFVRNIVVRRLARGLLSSVRAHDSGPAYATFPGAINVLAIALMRTTDLSSTEPGRWLIFGMAAVGTGLGLALTVVFFVATFESQEFEAEDISGMWFIPETVILLGAVLFGDLSGMVDVSMQRTAAVVSFALLGIGLILFLLTAMLFFNRLVLHRQVQRVGVPAMWIMISPLSVSVLAIQVVAADTAMLGGTWGPAVLQTANFLSAILWGFSLWWVAAATLITIHDGRRAITYSAADWAFVFPSAALVLATLNLGRFWESGFMEGLGVAFSFVLIAVWVSVFVSSIVALVRERRAGGPTPPTPAID